MTRAEFDNWIEQHYGELLAVAKRRGGSEDTVQSAVLRVLSTQSYSRIVGSSAWTWMVGAVRSVAADQRDSSTSQQRLRGEFKTVQRTIHRASVSHGWKRPAPRAE